jgi:hypothetical protein
MKTHEGATQFEHSLDHAVEFFSKAGSVYADSESFYEGEESALSLFQKSWIVEPDTTMKLLFWLRNCRGGAGNRSGFRECLKWLANNDPKWPAANLHLVPHYGRWDDLRALYGTELELDAASFWATALKKQEVLAAKWADRSDKPIRRILEMKIGDFRRYLAKIRRPHIVEHLMCTGQWKEIEFGKVPSVAMSRYSKAFIRHEEERFQAFKDAVEKGEEKIHAGTLFPHDCVRTVLNGDAQTGDLQFAALPNYMDTGEKIMMICDTSGSMSTPVSASSSVRAVHVSMGLSLYCSAKMPADSPFHKKFVAFCSEGKFVDWGKYRFSEALGNHEIFDGAVGATRVDKALDLILNTAKFFHIGQELMPTMLCIVSDMQFHNGVEEGNGTPVNAAMKRWEDAGYKRPAIVYWNVAGYAGSPDTVKSENTALISGFSPATLKAVFAGEDFTPRGVMEQALREYEIIIPE